MQPPRCLLFHLLFILVCIIPAKDRISWFLDVAFFNLSMFGEVKSYFFLIVFSNVEASEPVSNLQSFWSLSALLQQYPYRYQKQDEFSCDTLWLQSIVPECLECTMNISMGHCQVHHGNTLISFIMLSSAFKSYLHLLKRDIWFLKCWHIKHTAHCLGRCLH